MTDRKITELAHDRDGDGELLPVEKTVNVRGEGEADVEVYPATSGQRRKWRRKLENDENDDELADETQIELFDTFLPYEPVEFGGADSWLDVRPALEDALANAIFSELFDVEEDEFDEALKGAMREVEGNPSAEPD